MAEYRRRSESIPSSSPSAATAASCSFRRVLFCIRRLLLVIGCAIFSVSSPAVLAQAPVPSVATAEGTNDANGLSPTLSDLVRTIIIEASREGYEDDRNWNKTSTRFDGLSIRGLNISRKKREVQHGFCRRYAARLIEPERTFQLEIEDLPPPEGKTLAYAIQARLKARCEATFAHFVYGVKGANGTTVADADVQVRIVLALSPKTEFSLLKPIPRVSLNAEVQEVRFKLKDIDARRVGLIDGKPAELLGDGLKEAFAQLLKNQEGRVKAKLQTRLDKFQQGAAAPTTAVPAK